MVSVFQLFKIGIGPSSSHTMGPMLAAKRFRDQLTTETVSVGVELFGSLAWTGRAHGSDTAICLGFLGQTPAGVNPDDVAEMMQRLRAEKGLFSEHRQFIAFDPDRDLVADLKTLIPPHSNAMRFRARARDGSMLKEKIYYSIGGGFILEEGEVVHLEGPEVPYPFASAAELLRLCETNRLSVAELQLANELALQPKPAAEAELDAICEAMFNCIDRGLRADGFLPGKLKVKRRAKGLIDRLEHGRFNNARQPHEVMDWVSAYAIAVNEENASGGRVVTAPTNGAAGIIPAVLRYYRDFFPGYTAEQGRTFLLTAAAIGAIIKSNASISGAEVGCQGEVGSAASMAAAGLAAVLGGSPEQLENAAEIAMEHHLGMTCDPVGGLVQIPCIERNAFGANKAIVAASLALHGDGSHRVSFDQVIETMRQTGADMQTKYKETSRGGLAVNVPEC